MEHTHRQVLPPSQERRYLQRRQGIYQCRVCEVECPTAERTVRWLNVEDCMRKETVVLKVVMTVSRARSFEAGRHVKRPSWGVERANETHVKSSVTERECTPVSMLGPLPRPRQKWARLTRAFRLALAFLRRALAPSLLVLLDPLVPPALSHAGFKVRCDRHDILTGTQDAAAHLVAIRIDYHKSVHPFQPPIRACTYVTFAGTMSAPRTHDSGSSSCDTRGH